MKSYEEMTASALERGKAKRQALKRKAAIGWTTACTCCLCLVLLAVTSPGKTEPAQQLQSVQNEPRVGIMLLSSETDTQPKELIRGVKQPYLYQIRVHEVDNLTEDEQKAFVQKEREYAEQIFGANAADRAFTCGAGENCVITLISMGRLVLTVDDYGMIKDYSVSTTENGYIDFIGRVFAGTDQGLQFGWTLSQMAFHKIEEDPKVKLSEFSDTITVCVEFIDGSVETVVADVMIQDDGQVFIIHRGVTVAA